MKKMTFEKFEETQRKYSELELPSINYGFTEADIDKIKSDPEKYMDLIIYIQTLPAYKNYDVPHKFKNLNALPQKQVAEEIENILYDNLTLYDK